MSMKKKPDSGSSLTDEQRGQAEEQLVKAAEDGRVQCASALAIARSLKLPSREVGQLADALDLRICKCQLSCF
nr:hypothetical protein [Desulfobulbaceae bacterium]